MILDLYIKKYLIKIFIGFIHKIFCNIKQFLSSFESMLSINYYLTSIIE